MPRRGRQTFHILILLQLLILGPKYKSGPESGPFGMGVDHLYSRTDFKLNPAAALTEWSNLFNE